MNGDTLWVWCYPSVSSDLRQVLLRKCCLTQDGRDFHTFVFGQFGRTWYYITTAEVHEPTALNKVCNSLTKYLSCQAGSKTAATTTFQLYRAFKLFFLSPSRSLIFQWLLLQKTLTLRSTQPSTECSAGTIRATNSMCNGVFTVVPLKHFECVCQSAGCISNTAAR